MNTTIKAVAYVRRSTKDQVQSLERQRHEIGRYARDQGVEVIRWYEDDGISGVEDAARPGFRQMVADAERQRDFDVILVHEISRFGRFDAHQSGSWLHRLKAARVRVQAIEGVVKDPYSIQGKLMLALEQDRQESVKLSMRTLSGQRETAAKGQRAGGKVPYGYARRRCKADGTVEIVGRVGRAKRDKSEVVEIVLGDPAEVAAVQSIFRMACEGVGYRSIAAHLNDRGFPSPDVAREKTNATVPGRWTATTVRALLLNPAYVGDLVWNVRSMPKFHRLEADRIVPLDEFEQNRFRFNQKADWVTVRDAHPAIVDRATFDTVQQKIRSHRVMPRGHVHQFLLTGLVYCANCGDAITGTTRTRKKVVGGEVRKYSQPLYICNGSLRTKGCRQIGLPRDGFERAVLRILDDEIFSSDARARLEQVLRREVSRRCTVNSGDGVVALEQREAELTKRIADGARRLLAVDESLIADVRTALTELKAERDRVHSAVKEAQRAAAVTTDGEQTIRETMEEFRSMEGVLRDPSLPLERRRETLRSLLPVRDGGRPICVYFDQNAAKGWRRALRRVTVRHLSTRAPEQAQEAEAAKTRAPEMSPFVVAGAGFEPATSGL